MLILVAAARWNFVNFQSPTYSAVMMDYTTPPSYGSTIVNVGGLVKDGEIICAGAENSALHTEVNEDAENEWPEPAAVKFSWKGKTKDGKPVIAELEGSLGKRLDKVDVLAEVPGFVKKIVGGVAGTKPYIYQVSHCLHSPRYAKVDKSLQYSPQSRLSLKINIDGVKNVEEGVLFSETTFIS